MKNNAAFSIRVSCFALALGSLSACSETSTGFGTSDAGIPAINFSAGSSASSSGPGATSATSGTGAGSASTTAVASSTTGAGTTAASSAGGVDAGVDAGSGNTGDPEPPDMVGMTAAHNEARAAVQPPATPPLPTMSWSSTIAASAQAFTTNCVFADTGPPYGSNAFAGTGTYTPAQVVASWVGEDANYDYATNTCAPGQMCGHYTQVVWRDSVGLGCGMTNCTKNNPFSGDGNGPWQLWVCNYDPPGNYVGEKPY
jgi:pathogenesis-related protein 1